MEQIIRGYTKTGLERKKELERLRRGFGGEAWDLVARAEKCECNANTGELVL